MEKPTAGGTSFINPTRPGKSGRAEGRSMGRPAYNTFAKTDIPGPKGAKGVLPPEVPGRALNG